MLLFMSGFWYACFVCEPSFNTNAKVYLFMAAVHYAAEIAINVWTRKPDRG